MKLYRAKKIVIGKIEGESNYFIDVVDSCGNQQTIATGSKKYVNSFSKKVILI